MSLIPFRRRIEICVIGEIVDKSCRKNIFSNSFGKPKVKCGCPGGYNRKVVRFMSLYKEQLYNFFVTIQYQDESTFRQKLNAPQRTKKLER